ncbi:peptide ABC transporter substrate-binding protein [Allokutzneria albata]|uniref:Oligopeptide transport system substrate-binding protein n=1 Tax=Allokutzneria albata TaxID=211114 RepID=A0A1G9QZX1_ALLAB|nr:ABC transporter substrate-binding protein [Allokutzneria albata]SDM15765.1 oligopeptide transport system substrate-binding protein [Allokutzneria albata]
MRRTLAALAVGTLLLTGCSGGPSAEPGVLSVGVREPASLLPGRVADLPGRQITGALWTPLTELGAADQPPVPLAAESVTSPDRLVWTVVLRQGWRFHDGSPVTARSYVGAWEASMREGWPGARVLTEQLRVAGLRAVDERTIEVRLGRPLGEFPKALTSPALLPLPESVLASRDWDRFAERPIGNGPYRLTVPWVRDKGARVEPFAGFAGAVRPKARGVDFRVINDPADQFAQVSAGTLDLATEVPSVRHAAMQQQYADRHWNWPAPEATYLAFPLADKRFADPSVRHAISLAIDRSALATGPLGHQVTAAASFVPPALTGEAAPGSCRPCAHDAQAAGVLLRQGGTGLSTLTLYYEQEEAGQRGWVSRIAEQLRSGLALSEVLVRGLPGDEYRKALAGKSFDGPYVLRADAGYPSPQALLEPLLSGTGSDVDSMLGEAAAAPPAASPRYYRLAENTVLRDLPMTPLWSAHGHLYWSKALSGVVTDPLRGVLLDRIEVRARP